MKRILYFCSILPFFLLILSIRISSSSPSFSTQNTLPLSPPSLSTLESLEIILQENSPIMLVNNAEVTLEPQRGSTPILVNNRILIPPFVLVDLLGGTTTYEESTGKVTIHLNEHTTIFTINSGLFQVNNENMFLPIPPLLRNGVPFVPIQFLHEGYEVRTDWINQRVLISTQQLPEGMENLMKALKNLPQIHHISTLPYSLEILFKGF
jgi:hypothetical protein